MSSHVDELRDALALVLARCAPWIHTAPPAPATALRTPLLEAAARWVLAQMPGREARMNVFLAHVRAEVEDNNLACPLDPIALDRELRREGAIVACSPETQLFDGAATPVSLGFINDEYEAPWDAWIGAIGASPVRARGRANHGELILSWVPVWAQHLVEDGMHMDPVDSMAWVRIVEDRVELAPRGEA